MTARRRALAPALVAGATAVLSIATLALAGVVGWVVAVVAYATTDAAVHDAFPLAENPFDLPFPDDPQLLVAVAGFVTAVAVGVVAIAALVLRMRRLGQPQRAQHAWFV